MVTIPGLTDWTAPLAGTERLIAEQGTTKDGPVSDVAKLGALYAMADLNVRPERFDAAGTYFTTQGGGDPLVVWFAPTIAVAASYGPVHQATGASKVFTRGVVTAGVDKVYEVEAEFEQVSVGGGESPVCRVGIHSMGATYADTDGTPQAVSPSSVVMTAGGILVVRHRFGAASRTECDGWADPASAVWLRPFAEVNVNGAASVGRVRRLLIRDVTDVVEAENFAFVRS